MAEKPKAPTKPKKPSKKMVKFKYVIPDHIKDCHVSGVWGGLINNGMLHMHFFNERPPIPNHITVEVDKEGATSEISKDTGGDIVRLIQASLIMDMGTANALREWLDRTIKSFEEQLPQEIQDKIKARKSK